MPKVRDLTGQRFGRLVALTPTEKRALRNIIWRFRCDCGVEVERAGGEVTKSSVSSCGCYRRETSAERITKIPRYAGTHGKTHTPTFTAWVNMIQRCTNPKHKSYHRYGGRGVTVCERWLNSFEAFLEDMGEKPSPELELDREKNHLGYEPGNCRWVTRLVNSNNREVCHAITHDGRTQNIKQWAAELGMHHQTIAYRLKAGWSVADALTRAVDYRNR